MKTSILIHPSELSRAWIDRMAEQRVDTLGLHPEGGKEAAETLARLLSLLETAEFRGLLDYAKARGLRIEYEFHAASYLVERSLFAEHPEYFRMNEAGERVSDWNFCPSSEEALRRAAERAVELSERLYGSDDTYFFWLDDARRGKCHCPRCRELSASDQQLIFLNALIGRLREKKPNAKLAYLAYYETLTLPTAVTPAEGIFLEFAPLDKSRRNAAERERFAEGIRAEAESRAPLLAFFGKQNSRVLEYWLDNSLFSNWKKPPVRLTCDAEEVRRDVAEYVALGYEDISTFGCFLGRDYEELYGEPDITPFTDAVRVYKKES